MERLSHGELRATLEFLRESYASPNLEAFQTCVLSGLMRLVHAEITAYNDIKPRFEILSRPSLDTLPDGPKILEWFVVHYPRLPEKHPLLAYYHRTGDGGAVKISDFQTQREFRGSELFCEVFRPVRMSYQMAVELHVPPSTTIGSVVMRGHRDFSERDRLILNLVRPHLVQAYRSARAMGRMRRNLGSLSETIERLPFGVIVLGRDSRVQTTTHRARKMLAAYFDDSNATADRLPAELGQWVRHEQAAAGAVDAPYRPRRPFVMKREGRRLMVRVLIDADQSLLLLDEHVTAFHPAMLESLGLTRRESEVLTEIIHEKTNREIAAHLGMSPRTVSTHLEHIYYKLGVASRDAAARYAFDAAIAHRAGDPTAQSGCGGPEQS